VRLRLRVKRVDLRRWGSSHDASAEIAVTPSGIGSRAVGRSASIGASNTMPVMARCKVMNDGCVELMLSAKASMAAGRPVRQSRAKRPLEPVSPDDEDEEENDREGEMICTWLQCDRCLKWRIVPDNLLDSSLEGDAWYCEMNVDRYHNRCDVPQQPDDAVVDFSYLAASGGKSGSAGAGSSGFSGRSRSLGLREGASAGSKRRTSSATTSCCSATTDCSVGSGPPSIGSASAHQAPRRRGASPAGRPSKGRGLALDAMCRAHPPASAFAATVAAHAAQTAKLSAEGAAGALQAGAHGVTPLFACVVLPGSATAAAPPHTALTPAQLSHTSSGLGPMAVPPGAPPAGALTPSPLQPSYSMTASAMASRAVPPGVMTPGALPFGAMPCGSLPSAMPSSSLPSVSMSSRTLPNGALPISTMPSSDGHTCQLPRSISATPSPQHQMPPLLVSPAQFYQNAAKRHQTEPGTDGPFTATPGVRVALPSIPLPLAAAPVMASAASASSAASAVTAAATAVRASTPPQPPLAVAAAASLVLPPHAPLTGCTARATVSLSQPTPVLSAVPQPFTQPWAGSRSGAGVPLHPSQPIVSSSLPPAHAQPQASLVLKDAQPPASVHTAVAQTPLPHLSVASSHSTQASSVSLAPLTAAITVPTATFGSATKPVPSPPLPLPRKTPVPYMPVTVPPRKAAAPTSATASMVAAPGTLPAPAMATSAPGTPLQSVALAMVSNGGASLAGKTMTRDVLTAISAAPDAPPVTPHCNTPPILFVGRCAVTRSSEALQVDLAVAAPGAPAAEDAVASGGDGHCSDGCGVNNWTLAGAH